MHRRLEQQGARLIGADFADLANFAADDHLAALGTFWVTASALAAGVAATRPTAASNPAFVDFCRKLLLEPRPATQAEARAFFERHFQPFRVEGDGFVTGYYEPEIAASLVRTPAFAAPVLARPADLVTFAPGATPAPLDPALAAARMGAGGALSPYSERTAIEASYSHTDVLAWLPDHVEVFLAQVQGSARLRLPDGTTLRLAYAGRNGQPYTSIGRLLIERADIAESEMSLARLKQWLRAAGAEGRALMQRNRSYVFFKLDPALDPHLGPTGAAGVPLTPLRSIAVDRNIWLYGLPFWLEADLPSGRLRRLTMAQDTGSAILGPARADIFFGWGDEAGVLAGDVRHRCAFWVLLPKESAP